MSQSLRPPADFDAERAVLGAMLLTLDSRLVALDLSSPADFYMPSHGRVFEAIASLHADGLGIDPLTVHGALTPDVQKVVTLDALFEIQNSTPLTAHVASYCHIVHDAAVRRRLLALAAEIQELAYTADSGALAASQAEVLVMRADEPTGGSISAGDAVRLYLDSDHDAVGLLSGFPALDDMADSLHPGRMTVLAARPGHGKTVLALQVAAWVAKTTPVLFFSLEMAALELAARALAVEASTSTRKLTRPDNAMRVAEAVLRVSPLELYIDDTASLTIPQIGARARRHKHTHGLGLVVVDYLQLVAPGRRGESREAEVAAMSRGLKQLARQLEVPVFVCAQLNRQLESRADRRPRLADLRESGSIEQDADSVWMIYNPEHFKSGADAEVIVAKNRHGATGTVSLFWESRCTRFRELAHENEAADNREAF